MPVPPPIEEEEWAGHSESEATRTMEWPVLMTQLDDLLRLSPGTVTPRDRNLFWLYYRNGMTAEAISQIPAMQLTAKGVESALQRMTRLLRETILNGKSKLELPQKSSFAQRKVKGFSPVIAIDSVERR
jgi:DNA-directed RNA polymerase specialized sigma24 family protein